VALRALTFLAADRDRLERFLALSGLDLEHLRARAAEPELLIGILEYLLANEALLLDFCAETRLKPDVPAGARAELVGERHGE
jgi:hypothetical protein